jgi:hypothetical protein
MDERLQSDHRGADNTHIELSCREQGGGGLIVGDVELANVLVDVDNADDGYNDYTECLVSSQSTDASKITDPDPTEKMMAMSHFCFRFIWSLKSIWAGIKMMETSVMMFTALSQSKGHICIFVTRTYGHRQIRIHQTSRVAVLD